MRVENKRCGWGFSFFQETQLSQVFNTIFKKNQVVDTILKQNQKINANMLLDIVYEFDKISPDRTVIQKLRENN